MDSTLSASAYCDRALGFIPSITAIACIQCGFVVPRDSIYRHFNQSRSHSLPASFVKQLLVELDRRHAGLISKSSVVFQKPFYPPLSNGPLPHLPILTGYFRCLCRLAPSQDPDIGDENGVCQFVAASHVQIDRHCRTVHGIRKETAGRPRLASRAVNPSDRNLDPNAPWISDVTCQRLGPSIVGRTPFQVRVLDTKGAKKENEEPERPKTDREYVTELLASEKAKSGLIFAPGSSNGASKRSATYGKSRWLEYTQWPAYFNGIRLADAVRLVELPSSDDGNDDSDERAVLVPIMAAFDALIDETRTMLANGKMNAFDQCRVSSFQRGTPYSRPIFIKLLDGTYKWYQRVWKQLLCYSIRLVYFRSGPRLHFRVTEQQTATLDRLIAAVTTDGPEARFRRLCLDYSLSPWQRL